MRRKEKFYTREIYHIFNKSIVNFGIFNSLNNGQAFIDRLYYYNDKLITESYSKYIEKNKVISFDSLLYPPNNPFIKYISYNIMLDHYHLLVKVLKENVVSKYMSDVENSYTKFLNRKFKRKGPLWQSEFKAVRIKTDEQLLHVSRYIHLNATTSSLVERPEDWQLSSYKEFITNPRILGEIITEISIKKPETYRKFVEDRKDYQRKLKLIKKLILE